MPFQLGNSAPPLCCYYRMCEIRKYTLTVVLKSIAFFSVSIKIHPIIIKLQHTDAERSMLPLRFLCAHRAVNRLIIITVRLTKQPEDQLQTHHKLHTMFISDT